MCSYETGKDKFCSQALIIILKKDTCKTDSGKLKVTSFPGLTGARRSELAPGNVFVSAFT